MLNTHCNRKVLRLTVMLLVFIITLSAASVPVFAQDTVSTHQNTKSVHTPVSVFIGNRKYEGSAFLKDAVTYVGIREFSMYMGAASVSWDGTSKTCSVKSDNLSISSKNSSSYIVANGRYLWAPSGIIIINGTMYVPIRTLAKAFGYSVQWSQKDFCAKLTYSASLEAGSTHYNSEELLWLSRIIHAEAQGESLLGKVAVGTVVLNRVNSSLYPSTIYGVIFDKKNGVQFTPAATGTVYCTPGEESIIAAKLCLDGARISDKVLFFVNEALATSSWVSDNRTFVMTVGNHKFFA